MVEFARSRLTAAVLWVTDGTIPFTAGTNFETVIRDTDAQFVRT
jgi:hypothetical protein